MSQKERQKEWRPFQRANYKNCRWIIGRFEVIISKNQKRGPEARFLIYVIEKVALQMKRDFVFMNVGLYDYSSANRDASFCNSFLLMFCRAMSRWCCIESSSVFEFAYLQSALITEIFSSAATFTASTTRSSALSLSRPDHLTKRLRFSNPLLFLFQFPL